MKLNEYASQAATALYSSTSAAFNGLAQAGAYGAKTTAWTAALIVEKTATVAKMTIPTVFAGGSAICLSDAYAYFNDQSSSLHNSTCDQFLPLWLNWYTAYHNIVHNIKTDESVEMCKQIAESENVKNTFSLALPAAMLLAVGAVFSYTIAAQIEKGASETKQAMFAKKEN